MTRLTIADLRAKAKKYEDDYYGVIAIRTQDVPFAVGKMDHTSCTWVDNSPLGDDLPGVCATSIETQAVKMHSCEANCQSGYYYGEHQAIIGGYYYTLGEDLGEVIISDPVVLEIIA